MPESGAHAKCSYDKILLFAEVATLPKRGVLVERGRLFQRSCDSNSSWAR